MHPLKAFHDNENQREAVKDFMVECLKEMAVDKTFNGEETTGIKESRELINKTFDKLAELYGKIKTINNDNPR